MTDPTSQAAPESLGDFLRRRQAWILPRWLAAVSRRPAGARPPGPVPGDRLPAVVSRVVEAVDRLARGDRSPPPRDEAVVEAATGRLAEGYELADVLGELSALRGVLLEEALGCRRSGDPAAEGQLVCEAVDQAMREAVTAHSSAKDKALHALVRLSSQALESRSIDELLPRLLAALLEAAPVDVACLLLSEGGQLVHRLAVGAGAREHEAVCVELGRGAAGRAAAERRPVAGTADLDDSPAGDILRARGVRGLYAVPLVADGRVLGVLQMGSRRVTDLPAEDRGLLRALAERVAFALEQHELRERAQRLAKDRDRLARQLQVALDAAEMGWWSFDPGAGAFSLDPRAAAILGLEGGAAHGLEEVLAAFHPEDRPRAVACLMAALEPGRGTFSDEYRLLRPDGSIGWIEDYGMGFFDDAHVVVGAVADITERKRTEEALRESSAKLQKALSIETVGVLYFRLDGTMLHANEAFQRMCGYGLEDLRTAAHWQSLTAPEYLEVTFEAATRLARTGRTPPYEKQMIRPDGSRWWGLFAPTRVSGAGERSECMEFVVEISEQKRAREEEQARAAFAQQLMGIVSHDLRSPLTAILMSSEAALRRPEADERLRAALRRIHSSGQRAHRLIRDLLDLTQAQLRGSIPIQRRRVELCSIVRQVADEVRQSHPGRDLRVETPACAEGEWDPDRVAQVAANLLSNSLQHGCKDSPVWIRLADTGSGVELSVTNRGVPIPAADLPRLFEPFQRGRGEQSPLGGTGGVGLGLFIVKQVVQAHGGEVEARSTAEAGTTFSVRLPKRPGWVHLEAPG